MRILWISSPRSHADELPQRKFESLFGPDLQRWLRSELAQYAPIRRRIAEAQGLLPRAARQRSWTMVKPMPVPIGDSARSFAG